MKSIKTILLCLFSFNASALADHSAFYAIQQNDSKALETILKQNPKPIQTNQEGQTLLHVAVLENNWQAVQVILKSKQININELDKHGKTAMDYAVEHGHEKIILKLYKNKGKVTSFENGNYAKKIITRPYKILFFLAISIVPISICICFTLGVIGLIPCGGDMVFGFIYLPALAVTSFILTGTSLIGYNKRNYIEVL